MKEKQAGRYEMDMCSGPILRKMLAFAVPLVCSSVLQLLFNAADIVVVGRFAGDHSLAAVGSNTSMINLLTNLFYRIVDWRQCSDGHLLRCKAGKKDLSETVHTSMLLSIFSGIFSGDWRIFYVPIRFWCGCRRRRKCWTWQRFI